jgi:hypothetical protein
MEKREKRQGREKNVEESDPMLIPKIEMTYVTVTGKISQSHSTLKAL